MLDFIDNNLIRYYNLVETKEYYEKLQMISTYERTRDWMIDKGNLERYSKRMEHIQGEYEEFLTLKQQIRPGLETLKIILIYLGMGFLWILLSDSVLEFLVKDEELFTNIQLYKGWFYVLITGGIFFSIIKKRLKLYEKSIDTILFGYEELDVAHEEMTAMNEELMEQNTQLEEQRNKILISEQRYELAVEGANDGIWDWDLKNNVYFFSDKWKKSLGYEKDELENTIERWKKLCHPDDWEHIYLKIQNYLKDARGIYETTYRVLNKSGEYRWILSRGKGIWDESGNPLRLAGSHTDITEQIRLQEMLREQKDLSESIIRDAPMIILVLDEKKTIIKFNPYAEGALGYDEKEVIGKNVFDILLADLQKPEENGLFAHRLEEESLYGKEVKTRCKDGTNRIILWKHNLLLDELQDIKGIVLIGMDITERREMEDKLEILAYYDTLTGLPNRALLENEVNKLMEQQEKFVLINLDLDDFKHINDTLGHAIGDSIMQHVSNVLSEEVAETGITARLSGDQFAIVFKFEDDRAGLPSKLTKLLNKIATPWKVNGQVYYITVTMGAAIYPDNGEDFQSLMQKSEIAMFHGKENGKGSTVFFEDAMYDKTLYYIQMSNQLRRAIENKEFMLYYQPQYDLKTERLIGVEALIRWNHPEKGFVSPMEFITFAERTGYIVQIDEWVLKTAIQQKRDWEKKGYPRIKMAINLSGYVVTKKDIVDKLCEILKAMDLQPGEVEIEVTETAVMMELETAKESLQKFKDLGILIALDDFGTGYSSLTYLNTLPFDVLKIDRDFIKDVKSENDNFYLYRAVVDLAHNMKLDVVAEGVETQEQKLFLTKNKCDVGQGYYFSRPIPALEVEELF